MIIKQQTLRQITYRNFSLGGRGKLMSWKHLASDMLKKVLPEVLMLRDRDASIFLRYTGTPITQR